MNNNNNKMLPQLGLYTTIAIVTGAVIGSGIFKKPAFIADQLGSPEWMLLIWVVAGILTLFGALTNSEVAGMITETGGQYIYFQKMYGELTAYLYGWAIFAVIQTGSIASITYVFSEYTQYFFLLPRFSPEIEQSVMLHIPFIGNIFPLMNIGVKLLTVFVIFLLSIINYFGVRFGGRIASFFTTSKVIAILILIAFGFAYGGGNFNNFVGSEFVGNGNVGFFAAFIAALSGAFWSYDGWNNITYIAGEVKQPQRTIPKALFIGTIVVITVYLLINVAFLYVMPVEEMAKSSLVAAAVAQKAIGPIGAGMVAALVMLSTFGTSNGTIMVSARVYYAMANRKMFFSSIGRIHPKFRTPGNALMLQATWASVLVISGSFDDLTDMLIFVSWIFYAFGAMGVFVLRKKIPNVDRPYKVWGYPYIPAIFVVFAFAFVIFTVYNDVNNYINGNARIINSLLGLLITLTGIPFYLWFKSRAKAK